MTGPVRPLVSRKKSNPLAFSGQLQGFPAKGQQTLPFCVSAPYPEDRHRASECVILSAPFGQIAFWEEDGRIARVALSPEPCEPQGSRASRSPVAAQLSHQIGCYLKDSSQRFVFDAADCGTAFQQRVWRALKAIPPGEVRTYGELAQSLASGPRAVAGACRANPWPLLIPCHRVVSAHGMGGYCGHTEGPYLAIKHWLLAHEGWR